jgi:hypothetical protein
MMRNPRFVTDFCVAEPVDELLHRGTASVMKWQTET